MKDTPRVGVFILGGIIPTDHFEFIFQTIRTLLSPYRVPSLLTVSVGLEKSSVPNNGL